MILAYTKASTHAALVISRERILAAKPKAADSCECTIPRPVSLGKRLGLGNLFLVHKLLLLLLLTVLLGRHDRGERSGGRRRVPAFS